MRETMTIKTPLIEKHHFCPDCIKKHPKKKWCKQWNKPIKDVALECEPKPEWERPE
jgi:predicted amidophosphoribosyltransferase